LGDDRLNEGELLLLHRERNALGGPVVVDLARPVPLGLAGGLVVFIFTMVAMSGGPPAMLSKITVGSVSFTAMVAALTGVVSWTLVLLYHRIPRSVARASVIYGAFVTWMLGSLVISGATRQGLQFILVQVAFLGAVLLAATARLVVGSRLDAVVASCLRFTAIVLIGAAILGTADVGLSVSPRPLAIVLVVCMGWFLAEYRLGEHSSLWWSLGALLAIAISLSRTALFAGFFLVVATMFLAASRHRARNAILCVLLVAGGYWAVTSWAPLRDRFVQGDVSFSVGGVNVNAEGRTKVWPVLWSEVQDQPLLGHGSGAASARSRTVGPAFDHPHNDYLRVLYDFGFVGVGLLAWFVVRSTRLLRSSRKRSRSSIPALAALNAGLGVLIVMVTDNPLDYSFVMIPLGALIGLGLASGLGVGRLRQPVYVAK